jgi:hypothetical protein
MEDNLNYDTLISELGNFPHIQGNLLNLWGTKECRNYLNGLIFNTSGRVSISSDGIPRARGFPLDVIQVITNLLLLHDTQFPEFVKKSRIKNTFIWD